MRLVHRLLFFCIVFAGHVLCALEFVGTSFPSAGGLSIAQGENTTIQWTGATGQVLVFAEQFITTTNTNNITLGVAPEGATSMLFTPNTTFPAGTYQMFIQDSSTDIIGNAEKFQLTGSQTSDNGLGGAEVLQSSAQASTNTTSVTSTSSTSSNIPSSTNNNNNDDNNDSDQKNVVTVTPPSSTTSSKSSTVSTTFTASAGSAGASTGSSTSSTSSQTGSTTTNAPVVAAANNQDSGASSKVDSSSTTSTSTSDGAVGAAGASSVTATPPPAAGTTEGAATNALDSFNPTNTGANASLQASDSSDSTPMTKSTKAALGAGVASALALLASIIGLGIWYRRRYKRNPEKRMTYGSELAFTADEEHWWQVKPGKIAEMGTGTPRVSRFFGRNSNRNSRASGASRTSSRWFGGFHRGPSAVNLAEDNIPAVPPIPSAFEGQRAVVAGGDDTGTLRDSQFLSPLTATGSGWLGNARGEIGTQRGSVWLSPLHRGPPSTPSPLESETGRIPEVPPIPHGFDGPRAEIDQTRGNSNWMSSMSISPRASKWLPSIHRPSLHRRPTNPSPLDGDGQLLLNQNQSRWSGETPRNSKWFGTSVTIKGSKWFNLGQRRPPSMISRMDEKDDHEPSRISKWLGGLNRATQSWARLPG